MNKKNDEFKKEQELLLQKDKEMYVLGAKLTDIIEADSPFWIDTWEKFYEWDRTKIRFRDPSELKTSKTEKLMPLISGPSYWENTTDPEFIAFRKIMDGLFPVLKSI